MNEIERKHTNARMSKIVRCGGMIFLCGQTAIGADIPDIEGQTAEVLARIDRLLTEAGSDRWHILSAMVHLKAIDDFAAMNRISGELDPAGFSAGTHYRGGASCVTRPARRGDGGSYHG